MLRDADGTPRPRSATELEETLRELDFVVDDTKVTVYLYKMNGSCYGEVEDRFGVTLGTGRFPHLGTLIRTMHLLGFDQFEIKDK